MSPVKSILDCQQFNAVNPVGTLVRYWRMAKEGEPSGVGPIQSPAYATECGQAVVFIQGCRGYIALSHVEPVAHISRAAEARL